MGRTEALTVGMAETLPCPMLLGQDLPYLLEVLDQTLGQAQGEGPEEPLIEGLYGEHLVPKEG